MKRVVHHGDTEDTERKKGKSSKFCVLETGIGFLMICSERLEDWSAIGAQSIGK
jgi:hypothetical protein